MTGENEYREKDRERERELEREKRKITWYVTYSLERRESRKTAQETRITRRNILGDGDGSNE